MTEFPPIPSLPDDQRPLHGLLVIDFSQFLAGPSCGLRLADLGARVIKIERPDGGDLCRRLYISNLELDGDSTLFHSINRNKESYSADLKNLDDLKRVKELVSMADAMIQNFRPGVIERLGLAYEAVKTLNPRIIYGSITGYGTTGPWRDKPGQDLLAQAMSGLTWLNGDADQGPVPVGIAVADILAGGHLAQGILAALVRRGITGQGGLVEASLMESVLDFQFEVLTTHLNDGGKLPERSSINNAHAYLSAPYGIYRTADGYLALSMMPVPPLAAILGCHELEQYIDPRSWFTERDAIKRALADHLRTRSTEAWLTLLEPADVWCADVLTWPRLLAHDGFKALRMTQDVTRPNGATLTTTRCPVRIDGKMLTSTRGAPSIGENNAEISSQLMTNTSNRDLLKS